MTNDNAVHRGIIVASYRRCSVNDLLLRAIKRGGDQKGTGAIKRGRSSLISAVTLVSIG